MSIAVRLRILCVDDEPRILDALALQLGRRYEVCTALSGAAALEVLAESPDFAVIISDMRMPGMDGASFLAKARKLVPNARRMLLTGQTDMNSAIAAVNQGNIFRFLTKPCPPPDLLAAVELAATDYRAEAQGRSEFARDIEERVSGRDSLTGLASRAGLLRWFESTSNASDSAAAVDLTVFHLHVDGYTELDNATEPDTFMRVERFVAERLRVCCPEALCTARWTDNQFVVVSGNGAADGQGLQICASDLASAIGAVLPPEPLAPISISLGASRWPADSAVPRTVIGFAEMAMLEARRLGGATACVFHPEWQQAADQRRGLLAALRHAIDHDELHVHYQPILNLADSSIHAIECLARWEHPRFGNVPPAVFVKLAEESGLIAQLGSRILQRACSEGKALIGQRPLRLAVNISVPQLLHAEFIAQLDGILKTTGFDPIALELEITESVFAQDLPRVAAILHALRNRGVRIAIDDFGTGYSSLAYLNQLPVTLIKIDRSFVHNMGAGGEAIIGAALDIARSRNISVVIEGVETAQSLSRLRELGASLMQGFLFAKPMPAATLSEWLRRTYPESSGADQVPSRQA